MPEIIVKTMPPHIAALVEPSLEEDMYSASLAILTSHLTAEAPSSIFTIPSVKFLRILITSLVHPRTTGTPVRRESSHLLSRILDIASPRTAKFDQVWKFQRSRKRRSEGSDSEDDYGGILEEESLFSKSESVWDVIEWSFFKGEGGWIDILNHTVRILRNDFDGCKRDGVEKIDQCILVQWLCDSGRKASFSTAIRAIFATSGREMMLDTPRGIYEDSPSTKAKRFTPEDIWGGSILLSHRIEIASMMYELSRLHPTFLNEEYYLDALVRKLLSLDHNSLSAFLANIQSCSFRIALCEVMAQQLSPESAKTVSKLKQEDFSSRVLKCYILCLPPAGREAAPDLAKYCVVTGFLFRGWVGYTKGEEGYPGLIEIVDEAHKKRLGRLDMLRGSAKEDVARIVNSEGFMMKTMAIRVQKDMGLV